MEEYMLKKVEENKSKFIENEIKLINDNKGTVTKVCEIIKIDIINKIRSYYCRVKHHKINNLNLIV